MIDLLYTEALKLKRSKLFLVSFAGALVSPVMNLFIFLGIKSNNPDVVNTFDRYFHQTNLFILIVLGTLLFSLIATFLYNREYKEDTLKNMLTIPIGRTQLIISKLLVLLIWIIFLMLTSYISCIILGLIGGFANFTLDVLISYLNEYILTGVLLFVLTPTVILVTLIYKDYVPSIAFSIVVSIISIMIINSDYCLIYPWTAPLSIVTGLVQSDKFSIINSWISLITVFIASFSANIIYFNKVDIK